MRWFVLGAISLAPLWAQTIRITSAPPTTPLYPGQSVFGFRVTVQQTGAAAAAPEGFLIVREVADEGNRDYVGLRRRLTDGLTYEGYRFPQLTCVPNCETGVRTLGESVRRVRRIELFAVLVDGNPPRDVAVSAPYVYPVVQSPDIAGVTPGSITLQSDGAFRVQTVGTRFTQSTDLNILLYRQDDITVAGRGFLATPSTTVPCSTSLSGTLTPGLCDLRVVNDTTIEGRLRTFANYGTPQRPREPEVWVGTFDVLLRWGEPIPETRVTSRLARQAYARGAVRITEPPRVESLSLNRLVVQASGAGTNVEFAPGGDNVLRLRAGGSLPAESVFRYRVSASPQALVWTVLREKGAATPVYARSLTVDNTRGAEASFPAAATAALSQSLPLRLNTAYELFLTMTPTQVVNYADREILRSGAIEFRTAPPVTAVELLTAELSPPPGTAIGEGASQEFRAQVRYALEGRTAATLALRLTQADGGLVAASPFLGVTTASGTRSLSIPAAPIPAGAGRLQLRAVALDRAAADAAVLAESAAVEYPVSAPPPTADSLSISDALPPAGTPLDENQSQTPVVTVAYRLGTKDSARLALRIVDQDGATRGDAPPVAVTRGEGTARVAAAPFAVVPRIQRIRIRAVLLDDAGAQLAAAPQVLEYPVGLDLSVKSIEVIQVTQTEQNEIPLVAGKPTAVRVTARVAGASYPDGLPNVAVELHASRQGVPVAGSPLRSEDARVRVAREPDRGRILQSHVVRLPDEWVEEGALTLRAVVDPDGAFPDIRRENNSLELPDPAIFQTRRGLKVRYLRVCFPVFLGWECPSDRVADLGVKIERMFPLAPRDFSYEPLPAPELRITVRPEASLPLLGRFYDADPRWNWMIDVLRKRDALTRDVTYDQLLAWLPNTVYGGLAGLSDAPFMGGRGRVLWVKDATDTNATETETTPVHEIGHNLGLRHPNLQGGVCPDSFDDQTDWPFRNESVQEYGYDPVSGAFSHPASTFTVMGYCPDQWMAPFHYLKLFDGFFRPRAFSAGRVRSAGVEAELVVLSGTVTRDGLGGKIDPPYRLIGESGDPAASGSHCIRFMRGDAEAARHCFTPAFRNPHTGFETDETRFLLRLAFPEGATRIELTHEGRTLASRAASASPPEISMTAPRPNDVWTGGRHDIAWTARDGDGDTLAFTVTYSADDGASWIPLELDLAERSLTVESGQLQPGTVRFRVMATDGFHTTTVEAGPVTLRPSPAAEVAAAFDLLNALPGAAARRNLAIRSTGSGPLEVRVETPPGAPFRLLSQPSMTIPAGTARSLALEFAPTGLGVQAGALRLRTNDPGRPAIEVRLSGKGVEREAPEIEVTPARLEFAGAGERAIAILNRGPAPLTVRAIRVEGAAFSVEARPAFTLAAGASAAVPVRYAPAVPGTAAGALLIESDDPAGSPSRVELQGN